MFKLFYKLLKQGCTTQRELFPELDESARGLPRVNYQANCQTSCNACEQLCPTTAIVLKSDETPPVSLDLGRCIGCNLCVEACPSGVITADRRTATAVTARQELISGAKPIAPPRALAGERPFTRSIAIRVVSTGCSACDLEIGAAFNPIFDAERFGISLVASPRMADALVVTGPVPRGMHEALRRTYEAMPEPRLVIAVGTCAISGGVHAHGYADANGVAGVLPVDVFIPGCPPHPWSIIHGITKAMQLPISET